MNTEPFKVRVQNKNYRLKFRAYCKDTGIMLTWENHLESILDIIKQAEYGGLAGKWILSQWTGRYDNAGKEIYTGDILETDIKNEFGSYLTVIAPVFYDLASAAFRLNVSPLVKSVNGFPFFNKVQSAEIVGDMFNNATLCPWVKA